MNNLILFTNAFLSYLLVFVICICVIIVAILIGIRLRRNKDNKDALAQTALEQTESAGASETSSQV